MQILQALLLFHTQFKIMDIHRNHIRTTFAFYVILLIAPQEFIGVTSANTFTIIALCGRDRLSLPYCMQIDSYSLQLPSISLLTGVPNSIKVIPRRDLIISQSLYPFSFEEWKCVAC